MSSEDYQISIIEDKLNPLLERREVKLEVASKSTPKRDLLRKAVASSLKVPVDSVYVRRCLSSFGTNVSVCRVHVYKDPERTCSAQEFIQKRKGASPFIPGRF